MLEQINSFEYGESIDIIIDSESADKRLDKILSEVLSGYSRSFIQKLFEDKLVYSGNKEISKSYKPRAGEHISFMIPEPEKLSLEPENVPLEIVYEDDELLVVNKPRNMVVHPAPGNYSGTLVNALLYHCGERLSNINGVVRPGIVHRIDKDTSGLLLVAKTNLAHISLSEQIKCHSVDREYRAVVHGKFKEKNGVINAPIGRSSSDRKKMCVTPTNSKNAVTHYEVLEEYKDFSLMRLCLETGRTHQIRVHMAYLGHPVAGDPVYGPKNGISFLNGQCLHAGIIGFDHPVTGKRIRFEIPLPEYFTDFIRRIK